MVKMFPVTYLRRRLVLLLVALNVSSASWAFEEADCDRLTPVEKNVKEPFKNANDYSAARSRALRRAYEEAVDQVIGVTVESKSESKTIIHGDVAIQEFKQLDKSELAAFIKTTILQEKTAILGDQDAVVLDMVIDVCVPKPDALKKFRQERADAARQPPRPVDPQLATWFDPKTGEPLLWYWHGKGQTYSFFDNKGFYPETGDPLQPVTPKVREQWQQDEQKREVAARDRQAREKKEEEQEATRREQEAEHLNQLARAPELCDQLAANPYDRMRPRQTSGTTYDILKGNVQDAIEFCQVAAKASPLEPRYRYELARAYQVREPVKAFPLLKSLVAQRYPPAFDNYGWALLDTRMGVNDLQGAIAAFRVGVALGDPDAMLSLANFILDGKTTGSIPEAVQLLRTAASQGQIDARTRLSEMEDQLKALQQQQLQEQQSQRMFLGVVGGVLQRMPRR